MNYYDIFFIFYRKFIIEYYFQKVYNQIILLYYIVNEYIKNIKFDNVIIMML